jgi:His/Glu/Gln/Arg/opine family amino acid ABC transporter permease subunit
MSQLHYNFDWGIAFRHPYSDWLVTGIEITLLVAVVTSILSFFLGTLLAVMRQSRIWIFRMLASAYVGLVRNIPGLFWLLFFYFVFPEILPFGWGARLNACNCYPVVASIIALTVNNSAYVSDIVRAGLLAVPAGQREAAMSAGLSRSQQYISVLLPQAVRIMLPPLSTRMIHNFKNTSLCMAISAPELTWATQQIESLTFRGLEVTALATGFYCAVALTLGGVARMLEKHWQTRIRNEEPWTSRLYGILD